MRQSSHILTSFVLSELVYIQWFPSSFSIIRSMVDLTPNGRPHSMHSNGSSPCNDTCSRVCFPKLSCGFNVMACSGQVLAQSPHCTQAFSTRLISGRSDRSLSAPVGHCETQAKHNVHLSGSTSIAP